MFLNAGISEDQIRRDVPCAGSLPVVITFSSQIAQRLLHTLLESRIRGHYFVVRGSDLLTAPLLMWTI